MTCVRCGMAQGERTDRSAAPTGSQAGCSTAWSANIPAWGSCALRHAGRAQGRPNLPESDNALREPSRPGRHVTSALRSCRARARKHAIDPPGLACPVRGTFRMCGGAGQAQKVTVRGLVSRAPRRGVSYGRSGSKSSWGRGRRHGSRLRPPARRGRRRCRRRGPRRCVRLPGRGGWSPFWALSALGTLVSVAVRAGRTPCWAT